MKFKLISNGRLLDNAVEQKALQAIIKIAHISEERAKTICLSGRQVKLKSADDREMLDKLCLSLRSAGIDVEVVDDSPQGTQNESEPTTPAQQITAQRPKSPMRILTKAIVLLIVIGYT